MKPRTIFAVVTLAVICIGAKYFYNVSKSERREVAFEAYRKSANEASIRQEELEKPILFFVGDEEFTVHGPATRQMTQSSVAAIVAAIPNPAQRRPMLGIEAISLEEVHVWTGVVRGPLDGAGDFYKLVSFDGAWSVIRKSFWVS